MPVAPSILQQLFETNIDANMQPLGGMPLNQENPSYFINFCSSIANGIAIGIPTIQFTTLDSGSTSAPPIPGAGTGIGIVVDAQFLSQELYTNCRNSVINQFKETLQSPWPPPSSNQAGLFLKAFTDGIATSIQTHFATCWMLTSVHPVVYTGVGNVLDGNFSGVSDSAITSAIQAAGASQQGLYWATLCKNIGKTLKTTIETKSTATVNILGVCVPSPSQVCGISMTGGVGTGVAA